MKSIVVPIIGIKFSSRFEAFQILAGTIDFNSDNFGHFGGPIKLQDRITYFSDFFMLLIIILPFMFFKVHNKCELKDDTLLIYEYERIHWEYKLHLFWIMALTFHKMGKKFFIIVSMYYYGENEGANVESFYVFIHEWRKTS